MAITILPGQSTGSKVGTGLGQALSGGLQNIANIKLQRMLQQHQQQRAIPGLTTLGFNPQQAQSIAGLDPQIQREIVKQHLAGPSNQMFAQSLNEALGGQQMQQPSMQEALNMPQQQGPMNQIEALQQALQGGFNPQQDQQQPQQMQQQGQQKNQQPQQMQQQGQQKNGINIPAGLKPQQALQLAQLGLQRQQVQSKEAKAEQMAINKSLNPRIEALDKASSAFKKDKFATDVLRKAVKSGKLTPASTARWKSTISNNAQSLFGGIGTALGAVAGGIAGSLIPGVGTFGGASAGAGAGGGLGTAAGSAIPKFVGTPLDQVFNKTVYGFLRNAKDVFGGNIAVQEMERFLETLPTLQMDDEAKLFVLDQMDEIGGLADAQTKAKNDIIKQNGGKAPANLFELIDQRVDPEVKKISSNLNNLIEKLIAQT